MTERMTFVRDGQGGHIILLGLDAAGPFQTHEIAELLDETKPVAGHYMRDMERRGVVVNIAQPRGRGYGALWAITPLGRDILTRVGQSRREYRVWRTKFDKRRQHVHDSNRGHGEQSLADL